MLRRDNLVVFEGDYGVAIKLAQGEDDLVNLSVDDARWLAFVALPAALASVPSEAPATIAEAPSSDGQIPGQLRIE